MLLVRNLVRFAIRQKSTAAQSAFKTSSRFSYKFMERLLDIDKKLCRMIVKDRPQFRYISRYDMKLSLTLLRRAGYSMSYVKQYVQLVSLPPEKLQNYLLFCQECGCYADKIGPIILKFDDFLNMRVSLLKTYGVIPEDMNVADSFLFFLGVPRNERSIRISDSNTIKEIYSLVYEYFLRNILHADEDFMSEMLEQKQHFTSIRVMKRNLKLMKNVFGFDNTKFLELPHLLHGDPDKVISKLKSNCAVAIKEAMYNNPQLIPKKSLEEVHQVNDFLQSHNIDISLLINDPLALSLNNDDLLYRLQKVVESPWLKVYKDHPRLPTLLRHYRIVNERVHILQKMNMKCFNMTLLTSDAKHFFEHVVQGIDQVSGSDSIVYVATKLRRPVADVKREMKKHHYLSFVSILTIQENLEFLRKKGFTDDEIFVCVQILLYPNDAIASKLDELITNSIIVNDTQEIQVIKKKYFLPLTLYFIEKENDFKIEPVDAPKSQQTDAPYLFSSNNQLEAVR